MEIKLTSAVIFVKDIHSARRFYEEVLGQKVEMDLGLNVGFAGGFALWQRDHATQIIFQRTLEGPAPQDRDFELYFETAQLDDACRRLEEAGVELIHPLTEMPWAQRVVRFYDPDGHILELGEPMPAVITRLMGEGLSVEAAAQKTSMPLDIVRLIAGV